VTRAFSGRPARGLRNRFVDDHPDAPAAYPKAAEVRKKRKNESTFLLFRPTLAALASWRSFSF